MERAYSEQGKTTLDILHEATNFTDWMYETVKPYLHGDILEVGSGVGTYSAKIIRDFPNSTIVLSDIDQHYFGYLKEKFSGRDNVDVKSVDLESPTDIRNAGRFDSVIALNVLEHIEADVNVLKNVYEQLNDGGRFIVLVPAHHFLFNRIDTAAGHYRRYDKPDMLRKTAQTGFRVEALFYFNLFAIIGWYWNGNILRKETLDEKATVIFDRVVPMLKFIEKHAVRGRAGISLIAILKK